MKSLLLTFLSIVGISNLSSQVQFEINLRYGKSLTTDESYSRINTYDQYQQLNPDQYILTNSTYTSHYEVNYSKLDRFEVEGSIIFPISNKLHIKTGIGLSYQEMSSKTNLVESNSHINSIDTLIGEVPVTIIIFPDEKPCIDQNSYFDVTVPNTISNVWSLLIPLEVEYDLLNKLSIGAGGYIQTPIVSKHRSYYVTREIVEELDDHNLCRYVLGVNEDNIGLNFNDLVFGYTLGASYSITDHIGLAIQYRHSMNGTYANDVNNSYLFYTNRSTFRNKSLMLGVSYRFENHNEKMLSMDQNPTEGRL